MSKKIFATPNFRNMLIVENPYLPKNAIPAVIEKPEDAEKYWDDFTSHYNFGKLILQCELDLSDYPITASEIYAVKPLKALAITCEGMIEAPKIQAKEINCISIVAEDVITDTLIYSEVCSINNLSVITLHPATSKAVNKCKKITQRKA